MKKAFLTFTFLAPILAVSAQSLFEWSKGSIVLADNTVLVGELSSQRYADLCIFRKDGEQTVLTPHKIKSLRYYDAVDDVNRQYISILDERPLAQWKLYEIVVQGKLKVIRRAKLLRLPHPADEVEDYHYFIYDRSKLVPLSRFKSEFYWKLAEERPVEIKEFVSRNRLNLNEMKAALLIIKEYNQLQDDGALVAKLD